MVLERSAKFKINKSRIRYYFYLGSLLPIITLSVILFSIYLDGQKKEQIATIKHLTNILLEEQKSFLKTSVEQVITTVDTIRKINESNNKGQNLSQQQIENLTAKEVAPIVRSIRLGTEDRYVWVNKVLDFSGGDNFAIRLIHPNSRLPEGALLSTNYQDEQGNFPYLRELIGITNEGEIYWEYYIRRMNSTETVRKLSYAKLYKPFNWVIATGIYLEDFENTIIKENQKLEEIYQLQKQLSLVASVVSLAFVALMVIFFEKSIRRLLHKYEEKQQGYNKQLRQLSITDQLTGLYNRLHLDNIFLAEIQKAKRYERPFSIIVLDFDHFKNINDNHGHQAGDSVLIELAKVLKAYVRTTDTPGRWGGEEFLIICPETTLSGALQLAENLRAIIEKRTFNIIVNTTSSFGIATFRPGDSEELMMERADSALYRAKELGRNRVETEVPLASNEGSNAGSFWSLLT